MAEEAALVAQEFISGLDNLPAEVAHLLGEIRTKEERCQELTLRLSNRTSSILKHVRNSLPAWTPYPKEAATLPKITSEFDKLAAMQAEKVLLSERLVGLMTKHVKKLELEVLGKVADLGGVPVPPLPIIPGVAGAPGPGSSIVIVGAGASGRGSVSGGSGGAGGGASGSGGGGMGGANGVGQRLVDSFGMDGQNKKRRLNALHPPSTSSPLTTSIPAASFYPQPLAHQYLPPPQIPSAYLPQGHQHQHQHQHHHQNSSSSSTPNLQLQQQQQQQQQPVQQQQRQAQAHVGRPQKRARTPEVVEEELAEAEEDDGAEDNTPYCFCRQKSFGEMVGCDNQHCKIEWFHVKCVDVEDPLPETWFCPDCVKAGAGRNKKGRKGGN